MKKPVIIFLLMLAVLSTVSVPHASACGSKNDVKVDKNGKILTDFLDKKIKEVESGEANDGAYLLKTSYLIQDTSVDGDDLVDYAKNYYSGSGYVDLCYLNTMIAYKDSDEIYFEPIKLNTIKKTAISRKAIKKRLKKLKITKTTYWKTACKRISTWIAKNYSYDKKQVWEYDLRKIWKKKKTVCHGYASIFYAMAKECGYDVHYVETSTHAFNYIEKNGKKYYYDVTSARVDYTDTVKTKKKGVTVSIKKNKVEVDKSYFAMKKFNLSKYIIYDYSY